MPGAPLAAVLALAGGFFGAGDPVWGALLLAAALVLGLLSSRSTAARLLAAAALLLLGAGGWRGAAPENAPLARMEGALRFRGLIAEDPTRTPQGPRLLVDLEASAEDPLRPWNSREGRLLLQVVGEPTPPPRKGDLAFFRAELRPPLTLRNPGSGSYHSHLRRKGVQARASAVWPGQIAFAEPGSGTSAWLRWRRQRAAEVLQVVPGQPGAVLNALLLGDWSGLSRATSDSFRACGTTHLVAISGLHLAILAMLVTPVWRRLLLLSPRLALGHPVEPFARALALPLLVGFAALSGFQTTTLRALLMTSLLILAGAWSRPVSPLGVLASAVLLLALPNPSVLGDPGLHLSVAALVGLFWLMPRLEERLLPEAAEDPLAPPPGRLRRFGDSLRSAGFRLAIASVCASLATMPVAAFHFGSASLLGLGVNLFAVPLVEFFCLPVALLGLAASSLSVAAAAPFWYLSGKALALLLRVQELLVPFAPQVEWAPLGTAWGLLGALALLAALGFALGERPRARRASAALVLGILGLGAPAVARQLMEDADRAVHLWALDVGQGQALVLRLPEPQGGEKWALVDAGGFPSTDFDVGERVVLPALEALGCDRLWLAVSTHPHPDHLGGMLSVLRAARPSTLWLPGSFAGDGRYGELLSAAAEVRTSVHWLGPAAVSTAVGGTRLDALSVDGPSENDRSLVLKLSSSGKTVLLPADLQAEGQALLLASGFSPRCDVLVAPHHGAANAVYQPFLEAARPAVLLVSAAGRRRLPSPEFLAAASRAGARIRSTYESGCLEVVLSRDGLVVRGEDGR